MERSLLHGTILPWLDHDHRLRGTEPELLREGDVPILMARSGHTSWDREIQSAHECDESGSWADIAHSAVS